MSSETQQPTTRFYNADLRANDAGTALLLENHSDWHNPPESWVVADDAHAIVDGYNERRRQHAARLTGWAFAIAGINAALAVVVILVLNAQDITLPGWGYLLLVGVPLFGVAIAYSLIGMLGSNPMLEITGIKIDYKLWPDLTVEQRDALFAARALGPHHPAALADVLLRQHQEDRATAMIAQAKAKEEARQQLEREAAELLHQSKSN